MLKQVVNVFLHFEIKLNVYFLYRSIRCIQAEAAKFLSSFEW